MLHSKHPLQQRCLFLSEQIKFDRSIHSKLDFIPQRRQHFVSSKREWVEREQFSEFVYPQLMGETHSAWNLIESDIIFFKWTAKCGSSLFLQMFFFFFYCFFFLSFPSVHHLSSLSLRLSDLLILCSVWQCSVGCQNSMIAHLRWTALWSALQKPAHFVRRERRTRCPQKANTDIQSKCTHLVFVQKHCLYGKSHLHVDHQLHTQALKFIWHCPREPE